MDCPTGHTTTVSIATLLSFNLETANVKRQNPAQPGKNQRSPMDHKQNADFYAICDMYTLSKLHAGWHIRSAVPYIHNAIVTRQYIIMRDEGSKPIAYASWAFLSLDAEARYLENPNSLSSKDWNSGNRLWFMDWISLGDKNVTFELFNYLTNTAFNKSVARSLRIKPDDPIAKIKSYRGVDVSFSESRRLLGLYYETLKEYCATRANSKLNL